MANSDYRKIEWLLVSFARSEGITVLTNNKSGDRFAECGTIDQDINLTELAKSLAEGLEP